MIADQVAGMTPSLLQKTAASPSVRSSALPEDSGFTKCEVVGFAEDSSGSSEFVITAGESTFAGNCWGEHHEDEG